MLLLLLLNKCPPKLFLTFLTVSVFKSHAALCCSVMLLEALCLFQPQVHFLFPLLLLFSLLKRFWAPSVVSAETRKQPVVHHPSQPLLEFNIKLVNQSVIRCPWWLSCKESTCNAGDWGLIPGWGRSPGERNGNPFQYSCLENSMDRGAWKSTVHGGGKESDTTEWLTLWLSVGYECLVSARLCAGYWTKHCCGPCGDAAELISGSDSVCVGT